MSSVRRFRGDRGAVVVEFALVAPVLFLVMFVLADFALAELSDAAGANDAAREGARVGVLYYDGAHVPGSTNNNKIVDAVESKLAGNVKGTPTVVVRCLEENGTARPSSGSCSTVGTNTVDVGEDLIEVSVTWTRRSSVTGFINDPTRTDVARMRIVGTPPTAASPPPGCSITASSTSPSSVVRSGSTIPNVTFAVTVSDAALCGTPLITFNNESGYSGAQAMTATTANNYEIVLDGAHSGAAWTAGVKASTVSANGGAVTQSVSFTVNDPAVCQITSATASPPSVTHTSGTLSSAVTFTVVESDAAVCGTPTLTFPANAGYAAAQTMTLSSTNTFTFTMPTTQGAGSWTAQTYTITAAASGGGGDSEPIGLIVSAAPVCSLSSLTITPSSATAKNNGQHEIQTTVTIRVTRSALTPTCNAPTVTVTPGLSGTSGGANDLTTAKTMRNVGTTTNCTNLTCEWVIANGTRDWHPGPNARTVTVTASGSTVTGTLTLTYT